MLSESAYTADSYGVVVHEDHVGFAVTGDVSEEGAAAPEAWAVAPVLVRFWTGAKVGAGVATNGDGIIINEDHVGFAVTGDVSEEGAAAPEAWAVLQSSFALGPWPKESDCWAALVA